MVVYSLKLPYYGIKDKQLRWFEGYLFESCQRVIYDGICFESQPVVFDVLQGCISGPMLFIRMITSNRRKILYFDETVVFIR